MEKLWQLVDARLSEKLAGINMFYLIMCALFFSFELLISCCYINTQEKQRSGHMMGANQLVIRKASLMWFNVG